MSYLADHKKNAAAAIEGYLFPDTYFFAKSDQAAQIIKKMYERLLQVLSRESIPPMAASRDYLHRLLTLASIVEKETGNAGERSIIASVYYNRLAKGMRLQADPTVVYGLKDYDGKIHKKDLITPHPYNTYTMKGLPPGPIAAVGVDAIRAVLKPDRTNFLYFVSKNDGSHEFCETLACHNKAVRRWQIDYFSRSSP